MAESMKKRTLTEFFKPPQKKLKASEDESQVTNPPVDVE
ncbi:unnamed protein product, partial [Diplocarpon coronariae]